MNLIEARRAIEGILADIPDDALPEFDRAELEEDGRVTVWWGGHGYTLGSATRNGRRDPAIYHERASWDAIEAEMVHRADRRFLENNDSPEGLALARKAVTR